MILDVCITISSLQNIFKSFEPFNVANTKFNVLLSQYKNILQPAIIFKQNIKRNSIKFFPLKCYALLNSLQKLTKKKKCNKPSGQEVGLCLISVWEVFLVHSTFTILANFVWPQMTTVNNILLLNELVSKIKQKWFKKLNFRNPASIEERHIGIEKHGLRFLYERILRTSTNEL